MNGSSDLIAVLLDEATDAAPATDTATAGAPATATATVTEVPNSDQFLA